MKKRAEFKDKELMYLERLINRRANLFHEMGLVNDSDLSTKFKEEYQSLIIMREKIWVQLHGTEATDVEGI